MFLKDCFSNGPPPPKPKHEKQKSNNSAAAPVSGYQNRILAKNKAKHHHDKTDQAEGKHHTLVFCKIGFDEVAMPHPLDDSSMPAK